MHLLVKRNGAACGIFPLFLYRKQWIGAFMCWWIKSVPLPELALQKNPRGLVQNVHVFQGTSN